MICNEKQVEMLRKRYPKGTKICLDYMDGEQRMPSGLMGKVAFIDDAGQIHVHWENGSGLALLPDVDKFHVAETPEKERKKGELSR